MSQTVKDEPLNPKYTSENLLRNQITPKQYTLLTYKAF